MEISKGTPHEASLSVPQPKNRFGLAPADNATAVFTLDSTLQKEKGLRSFPHLNPRDFSGVGWVRDFVPQILSDRQNGGFVLLGSGPLAPHEDVSASRLERAANYTKAQHQLAERAGLPIETLSFYIEWGNFVPLSPSAAVVTTSIFQDNPHLSEMTLRKELATYGIEEIILTEPIETCGHADTMITRLGDIVYTIAITPQTQIVANPTTISDKIEFATNTLQTLRNAVEQWAKTAGEELIYHQLTSPIIDSDLRNGELVLCSPVNLVDFIDSRGKRILLLPEPVGKTSAGHPLTSILSKDNNDLILDVFMENKIKIKQSLPQGTTVDKVPTRLQGQGGPRCLTARWFAE